MENIARLHQLDPVTFTSGSAISNEFMDIRGMAGGVIHMPDAWTAASIGFLVGYQGRPDDMQALYDENGSLVQISSPTAGRTYAIPSRIFGAHFVKLWSQTGGSGVNQAAARSMSAQWKG